jgi:hypothetical protein
MLKKKVWWQGHRGYHFANLRRFSEAEGELHVQKYNHKKTRKEREGKRGGRGRDRRWPGRGEGGGRCRCSNNNELSNLVKVLGGLVEAFLWVIVFFGKGKKKKKVEKGSTVKGGLV